MQPYTLPQMVQKYQQLLAQVQAGSISQEQFINRVLQLRTQDEAGSWWTIDPRDGSFLKYDGEQWVPTVPPGYAPLPPQAVRPTPSQRTKPQPSRWRAIIPFVGLILSVSCGFFWALYTTLRIGQNEPVDCLTPIIMIALPALLWVFRKPLDAIMRPVASTRDVVPRPLLIGAAFALPIVIGLVCSTLVTSGYGAMRFTVLVGIIGAYLLTYKPEVQP